MILKNNAIFQFTDMYFGEDEMYTQLFNVDDMLQYDLRRSLRSEFTHTIGDYIWKFNLNMINTAY
jgi:hypothetical protein